MKKEVAISPPRSAKGRFVYGTDPGIISELKALAKSNDGLLKAETVVQAARAANSPLHDKFEWDDSEAAERFRLIQARALISISFQYMPRNDKMMATKVFVSLSTDRTKRDGAGYRTLVSVMSDPDMKNQLLMDSLEQMTHFQEKYKALEELGELFTAMHATKRKIERVVRG